MIHLAHHHHHHHRWRHRSRARRPTNNIVLIELIARRPSRAAARLAGRLARSQQRHTIAFGESFYRLARLVIGAESERKSQMEAGPINLCDGDRFAHMIRRSFARRSLKHAPSSCPIANAIGHHHRDWLQSTDWPLIRSSEISMLSWAHEFVC